MRRRQEPQADPWARISDEARQAILAAALGNADRALRDAMLMQPVRLCYPRAIDVASWPAVGC